MDETRPQEHALPAEQSQVAQRNLAAWLAQDLNQLTHDFHTVALEVTSTVVGIKIMGKDNDQDPPVQ